jgi:predicted flap endonuclease-1-like 5' DNA nuclease
MDLMQQPAHIARQLVEINLNTMNKMFQLTGNGIKQLMELTADYLQRLSQPEGMQDLLQIQRNYGQTLANGIREDLQERGELLRGAFKQTTEVFRDGWIDTSESVEAGISGATHQAKETVSGIAENIKEDLAQINGVGQVFAEQLREAGIFTLAQVVLINVDDLVDKGHPLHRLKGRMESEQWIAQAKNLLNPIS